MDLSHVILRIVVTDLPTSTLWYQRMLELEPMEPDDGTSVFLLTPSTALQLREEDEVTSTAPGCDLSLRVPDLGVAVAHVESLGIAHSDVVTLGEASGMFLVQDPDGREVTFLQVAT
ncbi:VOC family protein [Cellulomonas cellasea]|uniref:VOC family protein n=1 Tax=Cellulomonas cellasea TaxID=43670 RepID=UPI0025A46DA9|nr:VOC family protein [Cellulomonas cellasea]MDM8084010.1 VOC family protein [Cellulomonas cellasea]